MEPAQVLQTIELLKAAKPIFESTHSSLTPWVGAVGAIGGALTALVPTYFMAQKAKREKTKSTIFQIYAEIKVTLEVAEHRGYEDSVRAIVSSYKDKAGSAEFPGFTVAVPDDRFVIYKENLSNLGLLPPKLQVKIVRFYQTAEAIIQDIKPGGVLNAPSGDLRQYEELLGFFLRAKAIGSDILKSIESTHPDVV